MIDLANLEAWLSPEASIFTNQRLTKNVDVPATAIASALSASTHIPVKVVV